MPTLSDALAPVDPVRVRRKVAWRVLPLVFLLYIVAYLDRANVGFAKLRDFAGPPSLGWSIRLSCNAVSGSTARGKCFTMKLTSEHRGGAPRRSGVSADS